jgi:hypothetical protein
MEKKICSKCKIEKDVCEFHKLHSSNDGYKPKCRECCKSEYQINKKRYSISNKKYRENNKLKLQSYHKLWYQSNQKSKLEKNKIYISNNKDKINNRIKSIRMSNPINKLKDNLRSRLRKFYKISNISKQNKTFDIVGCSPEFLKEYIEKQFTDGMSWDLMGKHIHIDHIIPLSSANTEEEVYKLCHYTNLQPLWAKDNLMKSNKILLP